MEGKRNIVIVGMYLQVSIQPCVNPAKPAPHPDANITAVPHIEGFGAG